MATGDEHDDESNLDHTQFRQLSSVQGRWLSPDPYLGSMDLANPQSLNRYAYVNNGPMNAVDPTGLATCLGPGGITYECDRPPANAQEPTTLPSSHPDWWDFVFLGSPTGMSAQQVFCMLMGGCVQFQQPNSGGSGNRGVPLPPAPQPTAKPVNPVKPVPYDQACPGTSLVLSTNYSFSVGLGLNGSASVGVNKTGITVTTQTSDVTVGTPQYFFGDTVGIYDVGQTAATIDVFFQHGGKRVSASLPVSRNGTITGAPIIGLGVGDGRFPPNGSLAYNNGTNSHSYCLTWDSLLGNK